MTTLCALIIEDDPKLAAIFSASLQSVGFDTIIDLEGNRYQTVLESDIVSIVFLDVHLPFASGLDILKAIRTDINQKDLPVVLMTADLFAGKSLEHQADHVLIKPISISRLQEIALALAKNKKDTVA